MRWPEQQPVAPARAAAAVAAAQVRYSVWLPGSGFLVTYNLCIQRKTLNVTELFLISKRKSPLQYVWGGPVKKFGQFEVGGLSFSEKRANVVFVEYIFLHPYAQSPYKTLHSSPIVSRLFCSAR
jgi:hypothetical protein